MIIAILSPYPERLLPVLSRPGDETTVIGDEDSEGAFERLTPDFAVSYGHRRIIGPETVSRFRDRLINLHISYLPWNRGADPNLWSFLDDTPKGVSIHYIDEGLDTGDIIAQREVTFGPEETLRTSYEKLHDALVALFAETWPDIPDGRNTRQPQPPGGSFHKAADKGPFMSQLPDGWDTPVAELGKLALTKTAKPGKT